MYAGVTGEAVCVMIGSLPEEVRTFGGPQVAPRGSGGYRGKRGRLSHILAICAQLDLRGDCVASALGFCGSCLAQNVKKTNKKKTRGGGSESVTAGVQV